MSGKTIRALPLLQFFRKTEARSFFGENHQNLES